MPLSIDAVSVATGLILGAALMWLVVRRLAAGAAMMARSEGEAERAALAARLDAAERHEAAVREERAARLAETEAALAEAREGLRRADSERAELATALVKEREAAAEKLALVADAQARLQESFKALCADALNQNNTSFLELAREKLEQFQAGARTDLEHRQKAIVDLVRPMHQSLEKMDGQIQEMEKARAGAYEGLKMQVGTLVQSQEMLRTETAGLVRALKAPNVRGRWGEIQLKRVVEMAGMLDHCDFTEQVGGIDAEGGRVRPDLVVRLPGGKIIVVDAKTPLDAYLDSAAATDDAGRHQAMTRHARHVRDHMRLLGAKSYWSQFESSTPEFVVMFLPGESFFSGALECDPGLIEAGIDQSVILATPTTLIALLRAVCYGWRQERLADNARVIAQLGRELFERLSTMGDHMHQLGSQLGRSVDSYNKAVGSLESRVMVTARRFKELDAAPETATLVELAPLDHIPRGLQSVELSLVHSAGD